MMLRSNLPTIFEITEKLDRVLDVGGVFGPLNSATHIADILPFDAAREPLDPARPVRFSAETFAQFDICQKHWPYPDKFFDFAFTSGTLEDVRDPIGAAQEMIRVSRAGYVEVPSRLREVFHHKRGYLWRRLIGRPLRVGFGHHRWLCDKTENGMTFTAKHAAAYHRDSIITFEDIGRQLTMEEATIAFFWTDSFEVSERLLIEPGLVEREFLEFKQRSIKEIRAKGLLHSETDRQPAPMSGQGLQQLSR